MVSVMVCAVGPKLKPQASGAAGNSQAYGSRQIGITWKGISLLFEVVATSGITLTCGVLRVPSRHLTDCLKPKRSKFSLHFGHSAKTGMSLSLCVWCQVCYIFGSPNIL